MRWKDLETNETVAVRMSVTVLSSHTAKRMICSSTRNVQLAMKRPD